MNNKENNSVNVNISVNDKSIVLEQINSNATVNFLIQENAECTVGILLKTEIGNLVLQGNISENSNIKIYVADFSKGNVNVTTDFKLATNSNFSWRLASVASQNDKKNIEVFVSHENPNSVANVENYGVCKDNSELVFAGTSHIKNKCVGSKTGQNARIMVFDSNCIAKAKPILKIDENEITANHAAVVGRVNDEHLFYLMSRGISSETAKQIITYGYLKPILEGFESEELKSEIDQLIEAKI